MVIIFSLQFIKIHPIIAGAIMTTAECRELGSEVGEDKSKFQTKK